jgi:hypothetical protein
MILFKAVRRAAAVGRRRSRCWLMSEPPFRIGYNTNGFAHHRLDDALHVIASWAIAPRRAHPDANHLPPYHTSDAQLRTTRALLEQLDLAVVVETGARYVLDPRRKHRPTLGGRRRRRIARAASTSSSGVRRSSWRSAATRSRSGPACRPPT